MAGVITRRGWLDVAWVLAWGIASSIWCWTAARDVGVTFDEPIYVARGLDFWRTGSHQGLMKLGTMPLPIDLDTLSLYLWERWQDIPWDPSNDLDRLIPVARAGTLVFWWILLIYGWKLANELAGPWGGRLAVAFLATEPSLLAHASLATTDVAVSACLLAFFFHYRVGRGQSWGRRIGLPALWFAAAVLAKASGLVFGLIAMLVIELATCEHRWAVIAYPWLVIVWLLSKLHRSTLGHSVDRPHAVFWSDLYGIVGLGMLLVFVYCGCDWRPEPSFVAWAHKLPAGTTRESMVSVAENLRIFSNAGEGIVRQVKHNMRGHSTYLLGDWSPRAFWYYFPVALSMKLTLPVLLLPLGLVFLMPRSLLSWMSLLAAALLLFSFNCRVQIGIRLVLPLIVVAVVGLGAALADAGARCHVDGDWRFRVLTGCSAAGLAWMSWAAIAVWPHGLCYVNELWGGTVNGYCHLSDSNYDWGQGLPELARWQKQRGVPELDVWYFGTDPILNKLPMHPVPLHGLPICSTEDVQSIVRGRYLAVGTTMLHGSMLGDDIRPHKFAVEFLRQHKPIARTTTFFIFDFISQDSRAGWNAGL